MTGRYPIWWIRGGQENAASAGGQSAPDNLIKDLLERLHGGDQETLLLLFLLVMLWKEDADRKLLLALAYILL